MSKFVIVFELRMKIFTAILSITKRKTLPNCYWKSGLQAQRCVFYSRNLFLPFYFIFSSNFCDFFQDMSLMMFNSATLRSGYLLKDTTEFALQLEHMMRDTLGVDRYWFIFFSLFYIYIHSRKVHLESIWNHSEPSELPLVLIPQTNNW